MKGKQFLKITGIIMIVGGALGAISGFIALAGINTLTQLIGSSEGAGYLYAVSGLATVGGILQVIAGIVGIKNCGNPTKAVTCITWGVVVAALCVIGTIINLIGGYGIQWFALALGLVLPALYVYGAFLNKKQVQ